MSMTIVKKLGISTEPSLPYPDRDRGEATFSKYLSQRAQRGGAGKVMPTALVSLTYFANRELIPFLQKLPRRTVHTIITQRLRENPAVLR